jgi:hypothetical protein
MNDNDWKIRIYGDRDPSPLVGYGELSAPVAVGDQHTTWVSLAATVRLDNPTGVDYSPPELTSWAPGYLWSGMIQIITPLRLANDRDLIASAASAGVASYDIDTAQDDSGWAIYVTDITVFRNAEGHAQINVSSAFRGDWGLNRIGFKADLLIRQGSQS